jgi:cytidylate kinase
MLNREGRNNTWAAYDKALIEKLMDNTGLSSSLIETLTTNARNHLTNFFQTTFSKFPPQVAVYLKLAETIRVLATNGNVVIVGRAGNSITREMHGGYHVRLVAPMDWRAERMGGILSVQKKEAEKIIRKKNDERMKFISEYVKFDLEDPHNYDMVLDNSRHSSDEAAGIIVNAMKTRGLIQ